MQGAMREISLACVPDALPGDTVACYAGLALRRFSAGTLELTTDPEAGWPSCLTPPELADQAAGLARDAGALVCSIGAVVSGAPAEARRVFSPFEALELAKTCPDREVVYFDVGFDTNAPAAALAVLRASREDVRNFGLLAAFLRVDSDDFVRNSAAVALVRQTMRVCDRSWRRLGLVPDSGYTLRAEFAQFDAVERHGLRAPAAPLAAGGLQPVRP